MMNDEHLYSLLSALPPDLVEIEKELKTNKYTPKDVTLAACKFCQDCFGEYTDFIFDNSREPFDYEIHSSYVFDICKLLLKYGLDPNMVLGEKYDQTNIMFEVYWITKPYVAADTLRLLLENGGDPFLKFEDRPLFNMVDSGIGYDVFEGYFDDPDYSVKFDCRFHFWLVLIGAIAEEDDDKQYLNHNDYVPAITKIDKNHWNIGTKKR